MTYILATNEATNEAINEAHKIRLIQFTKLDLIWRRGQRLPEEQRGQVTQTLFDAKLWHGHFLDNGISMFPNSIAPPTLEVYPV